MGIVARQKFLTLTTNFLCCALPQSTQRSNSLFLTQDAKSQRKRRVSVVRPLSVNQPFVGVEHPKQAFVSFAPPSRPLRLSVRSKNQHKSVKSVSSACSLKVALLVAQYFQRLFIIFSQHPFSHYLNICYAQAESNFIASHFRKHVTFVCCTTI